MSRTKELKRDRRYSRLSRLRQMANTRLWPSPGIQADIKLKNFYPITDGKGPGNTKKRNARHGRPRGR